MLFEHQDATHALVEPLLSDDTFLHSIDDGIKGLDEVLRTKQDVMELWGYSSIVNASQRISKLEKDNVVERIKKGVYKKLAKAV